HHPGQRGGGDPGGAPLRAAADEAPRAAGDRTGVVLPVQHPRRGGPPDRGAPARTHPFRLLTLLWNPRILSVAVALLIAAGALVLVAVEIDSRLLAILAMVAMGLAGIFFLLSLWRPRRVDWKRVRTEQRLWESGPLGRRWLRIRQRLGDQFKL